MRNQNGNALFIILIAVILFAALSYAVTSSSRTGDTQITRENTRLNIAKVESFVATTRAGIQRTVLVNKANPWDLSFKNNAWLYVNGSVKDPIGTPADPSLFIFHPSGGAVTAMAFDGLARDCPSCTAFNTKPGSGAMNWCAVPNIGSTAPELIMGIGGITIDACQQINAKEGIATIADDAPGYAPQNFTTGTQPTTSTCMFSPFSTALAGKYSFCLHNVATDRYTAVFVVLEQ